MVEVIVGGNAVVTNDGVDRSPVPNVGVIDAMRIMAGMSAAGKIAEE